jgi:glycosyltransferase involved in cell wall biosynthesis
MVATYPPPSPVASRPRVSVLMPVYNTARFVAEAVNSILCQTFEDFEFIIIDDGSKDGSADVLRGLAARDRRIRLIVRPNKGLVDTRNELLHAARGELIAWADSDDRYASSRLDKQVARFREEPELVALGSRWQMVDSDGLPIRTFSFPETHEEIVPFMYEIDNALWFPTVMMKRDAAVRVGGFRHPFVIAEDYDLHMRLSEVGRMANLPDRLCYYRQHFTSTVNCRHWQAPTYARLARTLGIERKENGSDRLQRGEPVELTFGPPLSHAENVEHLRTKWAWMALWDGHLDTARKHAALITAKNPRKPANWNLLFCAIRGY